MTSKRSTPSTAKQITHEILDALFGGATEKVGVRLWDGSHWPDDQPRRATLVLNHPGALRHMLLPGTEVALGEAYLYGDIDIEGHAESVFDLAEQLTSFQPGWIDKLGLALKLLRLPSQAFSHDTERGPADMRGRQHSLRRDREAVTYHYDVSNEFYQLWLDERMVYSCGYFHRPDDDLDSAQQQKLDHICRKLRLQPGQRMLDIGCGWGSLVIYAAQNYGVDATGITLSKPQAALANERIAQAGLADRCRVLVQDYREVSAETPYDALVSVGMFEHVGAAMLPAYFRQAYELLRPGGVFLNHGIASRATNPPQRGPTFSDTYVFPDGELVPINVTVNAAENACFEVRDVESLREHYALTLRHWVSRLEANRDKAREFVDEPTYRVWRLFMSGSAHGFQSGRLNIYQALLAKPDANGDAHLPLTRSDWYAP
jgi:cyclopropane-fatty-acyl-phospholipid synthase